MNRIRGLNRILNFQQKKQFFVLVILMLISMILEILLVLIISYYFFNTKISQRQMIGVVLALFAIYLIIVDK